MANRGWPAADAVVQALLARPAEFGLQRAVRLVERSVPGAETVGGNDVEAEAVRLRVSPSLAFPRADLEAAEVVVDARGRSRVALSATFLGLHGASSPLPSFYAEEIVQALHSNDGVDARRDFLDLFHHRLLSCFIKLMRKYRHDEHFQDEACDVYSQRLLGLAGLDGATVRERVGEARGERLLAGLALVALRFRSPAVVARALAHFLPGLGVVVREFIERRVPVPEGQRCRLGAAAAGLGVNAVLGATVPDDAGKCAIVLGPLDFATFRGQLPDRAGFPRVRRLTRWLLRDPLAFDVVLRLAASEVPRSRLGADPDQRLGWSMWLGHARGGAQEVAFSDTHAAHAVAA